MVNCPRDETFVVVESSGLGSAVTLRPNKDSARNAIVIGDPTNSALSDGVVSGWRIYAKIVSIEHRVFLQVYCDDAVRRQRHRFRI